MKTAIQGALNYALAYVVLGALACFWFLTVEKEGAGNASLARE